MVMDPAPETERIRRLKLAVSRLKLSEDDRAFLREAIDFLALQRANDRLMLVTTSRSSSTGNATRTAMSSRYQRCRTVTAQGTAFRMR
jgi:hypothetical protein